MGFVSILNMVDRLRARSLFFVVGMDYNARFGGSYHVLVLRALTTYI